MVIFDTLRHWLFFILLTTIFFTYLTLINLCTKDNLKKTRISQFGVKKIVAYSLRKKIEIESEQYECEEEIKVNVKNDLNKSVESYASVDIIGVNGNSSRWNDGYSDSSAWTRIENTNVYVSSVNLDKRLDPYNYIRIIAVVKGYLGDKIIYCKIISRKGTYIYIKTTIAPIWASNWNKNDNNTYYHPILISCRIPFETVPINVSLTTVPCEAAESERVLKINTSQFKPKKYTTVCVKPLDYLEDISERLIQWIEVIRILGAEKIEIYVKRLGRNAWNILKWYNTTFPDKIMVQKFSSMPDIVTNNGTRPHSDDLSKNIWQTRRFEIVAYNNCFYKNLHSSHFVVPLDIDEIIIPRKGTTWKKFLKAIFASFPELEESFASLTVPNAYYFGNISKTKHSIFFMENIKRTSYSPAGESGKSFINTKNTLTVFNHYAMDTLRPGVSKAYFLPSNFIQLNHYKESCNAVILPECIKYTFSPRIDDSVMWKMKAKFTVRYNRIISKLEGLGLLSH